MPSKIPVRCFSAAFTCSQVSLIRSGIGLHDVAEDVRVAADHLLLEPARHVLDVELARLGGDRGVQVDLQQHVAQLFAEVLGAASVLERLDGLDRLVGLLEQVLGQRAVGLRSLPAALGAEPRHDLDELDQRGLACRQ